MFFSQSKNVKNQFLNYIGQWRFFFQLSSFYGHEQVEDYNRESRAKIIRRRLKRCCGKKVHRTFSYHKPSLSLLEGFRQCFRASSAFGPVNFISVEKKNYSTL